MFWRRRQGEKDLLESLYRLYEQKMYAAAFSILHSREQAEDAVHDSFVKLVPYLKDIESAECAKAKQLVMRIVKTTAIDQYRRNHRNAGKTEEWELTAKEDSRDMFTQSVEDRILIKTLLDELPDDYKEVIRLRCYYGFSVKETGEILNISQDNVSKRLERARKMLIQVSGREEINYDRKKFRTDIKGISQ